MRLCTHLVEYKEGDFSKCHHIRLLPLRCWSWNRAAANRQLPLQLVYLLVSYLAVEDSARLCHMGTFSLEVVSCRLWTYDMYMIGSQITTAAEIKNTKSHYDRRAVQTHRQLYDTPGSVFV